eukprot:CAMPEP_0180792184 /NCGR_PEP_ID=MMETSP1038_2-20121128/54254_1 /TAXON_ID=632150 /ORGANISM="Azadinium spinosum, Strain 3D9" /LENGTH=159 /DNA_ID=CAMNT_0022830467 /DNA_START=715 /DNA_END=1195 /DNA_ORIENTATION=+
MGIFWILSCAVLDASRGRHYAANIVPAELTSKKGQSETSGILLIQIGLLLPLLFRLVDGAVGMDEQERIPWKDAMRSNQPTKASAGMMEVVGKPRGLDTQKGIHAKPQALAAIPENARVRTRRWDKPVSVLASLLLTMMNDATCISTVMINPKTNPINA